MSLNSSIDAFKPVNRALRVASSTAAATITASSHTAGRPALTAAASALVLRR